jgi:hypothetical protein
LATKEHLRREIQRTSKRELIEKWVYHSAYWSIHSEQTRWMP